MLYYDAAMLEDSLQDTTAVAERLDRGWHELSSGDLGAARDSANQVLEVDNENPAGQTLLGAIAAAEGDTEQALVYFRQALVADPNYLDAMFCAAELAIHPLGDPDYALSLCRDAEAVAMLPEERQEVQVLRTEALLAAGDVDQAEECFERMPHDFEDAAFDLRVGRIALELGECTEAYQLLKRAVTRPDLAADAHYYLGVCCEMLDEHAASVAHFRSTLAIDASQPPAPWSLEASVFSELCDDVVSSLGQPLQRLLTGVPVIARDGPAEELVADGIDPRTVVFFAATPADGELPEGQPSEAMSLTSIFVYQRNMERCCANANHLPMELRRALVDELAIFFDVTPNDLDRDSHTAN